MKRVQIRSRILSAAGILGFVGAIVVFDLGCPSSDSNSGAAVVAQVRVTGPGAVRVGGTVTLSVVLFNNSGSVVSGVPVTWKSSDVTIATVSGDANGAYVTGVAQGPVTITATAQFVASPSHAVIVSNVPVATVTVSGPSSVQIGSSIQLTATPKDAAGNPLTGRVVTWLSSAPLIASVNSSTGQVTGLAVGGPVTITATSEFTDGTAQVTVTGAPVASVTLSGLSTVDIGVGIGLTVVLKDAAGNVLSNRQVSWLSSNTGVATVSGDNTGATVTGVAAGTVIITATSENVPGTKQITVGPAILSGQVINYVTGAGIAGATVNYRDASQALWGSNTSGAGGSFTSPATSTNIANGVIIEAVAAGFVTGRIFVPNVTPGVTNYAGQLPLVPNATAGGISGTVRHALNATGIAGVTVALYDNIALGPITTQTSDANGDFTFNNVSAGTYRLHASATGFTSVNRTGVAVGNGNVTSGQDIVLAPSGTNFVRIVLTWGNSPFDLDSHITGPSGGTRFHVYYAGRGSLSAAPFTFLDIDDVSAFGPETITITQLNSGGNYRYSVHDFSNRSSTTSTALGASGARVEVYTSAGLAQTFPVPQGAGTLWTVFELSGTLANPLITPLNTKSFLSDPGAVPSPPIADGTDAALIGRAVAQHPKAKP